MSMPTASREPASNAIDLLVLTALAVEYKLPRRMLQGARERREPIRHTTGQWGARKTVLVQTGPGYRRATEASQWAFRQWQPRRAVMIGFAGGLDPKLAVGDVVVADQLLSPVAPSLPATSLSLPMVRVGPIVTARELVATATDKRRLFEQTAALAVDLESYAVARVSQDRQVPFSAIRAISDDATTTLDPLLATVVLPDGRIDAWNVLRQFGLRPRLWLYVMRIARSSYAAQRQLHSMLKHLPEASEGQK